MTLEIHLSLNSELFQQSGPTCKSIPLFPDLNLVGITAQLCFYNGPDTCTTTGAGITDLLLRLEVLFCIKQNSLPDGTTPITRNCIMAT